MTGQSASEDIRPAPSLVIAGEDHVWMSRLAELVCAQILRWPGVSDIVVSVDFGPARDSALRVLHPEGRLPSEGLAAAVDEARQLGVPVVAGALPGRTEGGDPTFFAAPLRPFDDGPVAAVFAVQLRVNDHSVLVAVMDLVNLSLGWPAAAFAVAQSHDAAARGGLTAGALGAVVTLAESADLSEALQGLAIDLKERFACDRVTVGLVRFRRVRVWAISNAAQISRAQPLVRNLAAAMEEALDQGSPLCWPLAEDIADGGTARVTVAQATLVQDDPRRSVYTVPMTVGERQVGAIVFERHDGSGFKSFELEVLEAVVSTLCPLLEEKRSNDRLLVVKALISLRGLLAGVLGRQYFAWKAAALGLALAVWTLAALQVPYTVKAEATVEGVQLRQVAASFDGFIAEAPVREGDRVGAGDLLLRLDDREQALELLRLTTQTEEMAFELDRAIGEQDQASAQIMRARLQQIEAQRRLIEERMARMRIIAPFDAVVLSGDPTRTVGRAVAQGEPLLTIAPAGEYRVRLSVEQTEAGLVRPGQSGTLRLAARPDAELSIEVRDVVPVALYRDGRTIFAAEARFVTVQSDALHGLEGRARLDAGNRSVGAVWFGPIRDRVWLWMWSLGLL